MAQSVTLYNLLISCPGDVKNEVALVESAVDEFNELYADPLGITIKTRYWGKSSYAQSGGKPQVLLNEQFVNKCDAAVAIFWTRFGSPTEEEIEILLQSGKQVFMYFSDKPIPPSKMNDDGYKKVQDFRDKYKDRGIYFTYSSDEEFKKMFFAHLSKYFLSYKKEQETVSERCSKLKLLGIDESGQLSEKAFVCPFVFNSKITMQEYISLIKTMYQEIADMNIDSRTPVNSNLFASFIKPVNIDEKERDFLISVAEHLKVDLPDSFFELGNLSQDSLTSNILSGPTFNGSPEEKEKYWKIQKLHETISKALEWAPIEKAFSGMRCIKLAVQNYGKAIDEDIEIILEFRKKMQTEQSKRILTSLNLFTQMRVKGGNDYISYVKQLLSGTVKEKKIFQNYDLKIVTDFEKFNQLMYQKEKEVQLVRMAAGYAWDWIRKK